MNPLQPELHLRHHAHRTAELQLAAMEDALIHQEARRPNRLRSLRFLRTRLGWSLVELGLRLATPGRRGRGGGAVVQGM